ncbi:unnamed protein product [Amoebophrya sp. A120]|nr:unnamed protein product [Amoebophrya sp. A120]|eukprot:GSA120T00013243001.1
MSNLFGSSPGGDHKGKRDHGGKAKDGLKTSRGTKPSSGAAAGTTGRSGAVGAKGRGKDAGVRKENDKKKQENKVDMTCWEYKKSGVCPRGGPPKCKWDHNVPLDLSLSPRNTSSNDSNGMNKNEVGGGAAPPAKRQKADVIRPPPAVMRSGERTIRAPPGKNKAGGAGGGANTPNGPALVPLNVNKNLPPGFPPSSGMTTTTNSGKNNSNEKGKGKKIKPVGNNANNPFANSTADHDLFGSTTVRKDNDKQKTTSTGGGRTLAQVNSVNAGKGAAGKTLAQINASAVAPAAGRVTTKGAPSLDGKNTTSKGAPPKTLAQINADAAAATAVPPAPLGGATTSKGGHKTLAQINAAAVTGAPVNSSGTVGVSKGNSNSKGGPGPSYDLLSNFKGKFNSVQQFAPPVAPAMTYQPPIQHKGLQQLTPNLVHGATTSTVMGEQFQHKGAGVNFGKGSKGQDLLNSFKGKFGKSNSDGKGAGKQQDGKLGAGSKWGYGRTWEKRPLLGPDGEPADDPTCWDFVRGGCRRGDKCKWLHEVPADC